MLLYRKFNLALKKDVCYLYPDPRPLPFRFCQCLYCKQQAGGWRGLGTSQCCFCFSIALHSSFWALLDCVVKATAQPSCENLLCDDFYTMENKTKLSTIPVKNLFFPLYMYIAPSLGRTFERCLYIWCCLGNGLYIRRSLINLNYVLIIKFVLHCWFGLCKCLQCHKFRSN